MRFTPLSLLLLCACSQSSDVMEELPNSSLAGAAREVVTETRMDAAQRRPVTIGEDGPRFAACSGRGQVTGVGAKGLAVRAAPFGDAPETARLATGDRPYICARSIDQKWLGIVAPPPAEATGDAPDGATVAVDCGVTDPVDSRRPYDGPCASGWVSSAAIRLVG
ncbi:MAG: hypothetical protein ABW039_05850 [Sphingobium sp.]